MIYSPIQLAFIKFLKACIAKNKAYGYINLTNKQIAERFEFQGRKYSHQNIALLISHIKQEFTFQSSGSRRYILSKSVTSQTLSCNQSDTRQQLVRHYTVTSQTLKPRQETLEPEDFSDLLLIDNLNLKSQDQDQEKNTKKVNPPESDLAVSTVSTLFSKDDVLFEECYQLHRQGEHKGRSSRALSWKRWKLLKREKALPGRETILKAIKIHQEANPNPQYRQGFQVFLNARPWLDIEDLESEDDVRRQIEEKYEKERAEYYANPEKWHQNNMNYRRAA